MKRKTFLILLTTITTIGLSLIFIPRIISLFEEPDEVETVVGYSTGTEFAIVTNILEEGEMTLGEVLQPYQTLSVTVLEGQFAGKSFEVEHGTRQIRSDYDIDWDKSLEYISNAKPYANKPCVYADTLFANLNDENIHETITIPEITLSGQFTANKKAPQSGVSKRKLSDEVKIDFEVNRQDIKLFVLSGDEMKLLDEARESVLQSERASETDLYSSIIMVILPFLPIICLLFYKWIVNQSRGR